jgi:predicted nicotinamide N-methyase
MAVALNIFTQSIADEDDTCYSRYFVKHISDSTETQIVIKSLRSHNHVGTRTWESGLFAAEFMHTFPHMFTRKHILELGSGVGITGLLSVSLLPRDLCPSQFTFTDYDEFVLSNLRENVSRNAQNNSDCSLQVEKLDWSCSIPDQLVADVILAADCIYSPDMAPLLLRSIETLFQRAVTRPPSICSGELPVILMGSRMVPSIVSRESSEVLTKSAFEEVSSIEVTYPCALVIKCRHYGSLSCYFARV